MRRRPTRLTRATTCAKSSLAAETQMAFARPAREGESCAPSYDEARNLSRKSNVGKPWQSSAASKPKCAERHPSMPSSSLDVAGWRKKSQSAILPRILASRVGNTPGPATNTGEGLHSLDLRDVVTARRLRYDDRVLRCSPHRNACATARPSPTTRLTMSCWQIQCATARGNIPPLYKELLVARGADPG